MRLSPSAKIIAGMLPTNGRTGVAAVSAATQEKQRLRKAEKLAKQSVKTAESALPPPPRGFLPREWAHLDVEKSSRQKVSILTWNLLAQALVRRDMFPGSDYLKVKDRIPCLMRELVHYDPDIALLQEVDRMSDHAPVLSLEYSYSYHIGYPDKPHGLLIAWKTSKFDKVSEKVGRLDEMSPLPAKDLAAPTRQELALSRATRNVFLLVALKNKNSPGGIILGTIHAFWHPKHVYERVRQLAILFAEARRYKESNEEWKDWEVVLAGDFNTQPAEFAYSLLMHHPVTQEQIDDFGQARVVHQSVDKLYDSDYVSPPHVVEDVEGGADAVDPDKVIWKSREAKEEDGLLTVEEFMRLFSWSEEEIRGSLGPTASTPTLSAIATSIPSALSTVISSLSSISLSSQPLPQSTPPPLSAYGSISLQLPALEGRRYVDREPGVQSGNGWFTTEDPEVVKKRKVGTDAEKRSRGDGEPGYTNFTPLWRCTLDYIFLLPSNPPSNARFVSLLGLHTKAEMEPGLPRKGVEPSDHVAIAAILEM